MTTPDELIAILNRFLDGSQEEIDIEQFRNWTKTGDAQTVIQLVIQLGKYNTNIGEGQGIEIGDRLDTELLKEIRDLVRSQQASQSPAHSCASVLDIDWHTISRNLLTEHRHLTTNQIVADRDMHHELDEMYVSLALVERTKPEQQSEQARLWQDTSLSEPEYEEKQRFEHQQFLQDVLRAGKGKSQGTRIAMIGEPGAGKTTLLCKIAFWLAESSEDIPILISLADLQEQSLEDYLLQKWLKDALKVVRIMPQQEEVLRSLFEGGRVWLLLDGADEMTTGAYLRSPLQTIHSELTGWVGQARVILTCRLNLWDAIPNALLNQFEIYRTLPFSYGDGKTSDQVGEFITKWFKGEQLGQELHQALEQPGKERIKDLAKNPLRLALLCRTWHLWREQGGLPDTKAKLYQGFVDDFYNFYESRPNKSHVKKQQRRKLNEALGKLAKWALAQPTARFRLRLSQIPEPLAQILGDEDEEGSLLWWLVSELNWLVNIGDSVESPGDAVYTFFHPTFQEYFAALAIDDWHFFLNHFPENPSHPDASYHIFEPQWKEVFLLWLGRQDVAREHREQFIQSLVEFEDGCEGFYWYRAYFIAAAGIAEFGNCSRADVVVTETVKRSFGFFDEKEKTWKGYIHPVPLLAQTALLETDCSRATYVIAQQIVPALALHSNERLALKAAEILGLIGSNNPKAISALVMLISNDSPSFALVRSKATKSLVKIGTGSQEAIRSLTQLLSTIQDKQVLIMVAGTLGKIDPGNLYAKNFLIELMHPSNDEEIRLQAAWHLLAFDHVNYHAVNTLDELRHSQKRGISWQASMILENGSVFTVRYDDPEDFSPEEISTAQECWNNSNSLIELLSEDKPALARREAIQAILEEVTYNYSETIAALVEQLYICLDTLTLQIIIEILGEVAIGDESVVRCLIHFIQTASPLPAVTTRTLSKILRDALFSLTVVSFKNYLQNEYYKSNPLRWSEIYQVIWYCAQIMTYPEFYGAWHS